jgi:hypothetical protein
MPGPVARAFTFKLDVKKRLACSRTSLRKGSSSGSSTHEFHAAHTAAGDAVRLKKIQGVTEVSFGIYEFCLYYATSKKLIAHIDLRQ